MKKYFLLLLLFPTVSFTQYKKEIDSLSRLIHKTKDIQIKVDSYRELIQIYITSDLPTAQTKINELKNLNQNNSCEKCEAMSDFLQARYYSMSLNSSDKIITYYKKSTDRSFKIKDYDFYSIAMMHLINHYVNKNKMDEAEVELKKYFELTKKINYTDYYNSIYYLYGKLYKRKGYNNLALKNLILADKYFKYKFSDDISIRIGDLLEIASFYTDLKNKEKANLYIKKALQLLKKTNHPITVVNTNFKMGEIEYKNKNYSKSLSYLTQILNPKDTAKTVPYKYDIALLMGQTYQEINELSKASLYTEMAVREFTKLQDSIYLINALTNNAKINLKKNNYPSAKKDIDIAKRLAQKQEVTLDIIDVYNTEIEYYKKIKNFEAALKSIRQKDFYLNKYNEKTNLANLNEQDIIYQTEKKEQQIQLLSTQNELAQKQKYIYIILLALLVLVGGSLLYGYRNKIKTAQKLKELSELKSRFFANISHEFRTPLTLIKSPVQSLQNEISDVNQKNKLQLIQTNSTRMLELVDQLLELSKIDSGNLKLILKNGTISLFLKSLIEPFEFQAKEKEIHFSASIHKSLENHLFDKDVIEKIVTNLVSNAFKYSPQDELIVFSSSVENSNLKLVVSNSGSDVKKEDLPKLFERFYQKNESQHGVGIGLALVKELVDLYKGTIVTSLENDELSFIVNIPLTVANENAVVIPTKETSSTIENATTCETEFPILLLVDDNAEIRSVIKDLFKNEYQILEAQNGETALKLAQKEIPDCIISDVMMPKMDGFEFTKQIKTNELTSFIPLILLTAKTSEEAHLEGLKSTADAFLTKPFNNDIVKATVLQLITERKKLHKRYSQELVLRPVDIVINSVEEKFIEKLQSILERQLSNSEFTSEDFASEIGMSRMQLHRKLKSLLGVSSTEFLRNERLKVSAELLKKGNGNISEIAYSVGFNDVSYFSKCFKEMYHCTPSEYIEKS
ncbi:response regulator [Flavobacterium sp. 25HG05S-40]|uniref:response regulator n=1 Tax=Flavobacterium sp. 25HG05S-40 TaxID=3458682 RepID=UPI0040450691